MRCAECGKEFEPARLGRPQKYCGVACRQKAVRARNITAYNEYHRRYYAAHREEISYRRKVKRVKGLK